MRRFWKMFGITYPIAFPFGFVFQRYLENTGYSDASGTWYTVYSAAFWSLPVAAVLSVLARAVLRRRQTGRS